MEVQPCCEEGILEGVVSRLLHSKPKAPDAIRQLGGLSWPSPPLVIHRAEMALLEGRPIGFPDFTMKVPKIEFCVVHDEAVRPVQPFANLVHFLFEERLKPERPVVPAMNPICFWVTVLPRVVHPVDVPSIPASVKPDRCQRHHLVVRQKARCLRVQHNGSLMQHSFPPFQEDATANLRLSRGRGLSLCTGARSRSHLPVGAKQRNHVCGA